MPSSAEPLLGALHEALEDALPRLVVHDEVVDRVALRRRVLGVAADVEVEAGAVLEEDVAGPTPRHDAAEEVPRDFVGTEPALPAQRAGDAVFVLEPENAPFHVRPFTAGAAQCTGRRMQLPVPRPYIAGVPMTRLTSVYSSSGPVSSRPGSRPKVSTWSARCDRRSLAVTVGDLARVDVFVPDGPGDEASLVLLVDEVDEADEILDDDRPPIRDRRDPRWCVLVAVVLLAGRGRSGRRCARVRERSRRYPREQDSFELGVLDAAEGARRGRLRSSSATSSWSTRAVAPSVPSTLAPSRTAAPRSRPSVYCDCSASVTASADRRARSNAARRSRRRRRGRGTSRRRRRSAPTSATSTSTSYGFISCVKIWSSVCEYAFASSFALTSSREYE